MGREREKNKVSAHQAACIGKVNLVVLQLQRLVLHADSVPRAAPHQCRVEKMEMVDREKSRNNQQERGGETAAATKGNEGRISLSLVRPPPRSRASAYTTRPSCQELSLALSHSLCARPRELSGFLASGWAVRFWFASTTMGQARSRLPVRSLLFPCPSQPRPPFETVFWSELVRSAFSMLVKLCSRAGNVNWLRSL